MFQFEKPLENVTQDQLLIMLEAARVAVLEGRAEAVLAQEYDRKGYDTYDYVPGVRNPAYSRSDDPYVIGLKITVDEYQDDWKRLDQIAKDLRDDESAKKLKDLEDQAAALAAKQARLQEEINALKK